MSRTYWLSYGAGVNSTALAILLCEGKLPQYRPFKLIFSDTGNEKDETYAYLHEHAIPYFQRHGVEYIGVRPELTVLEYWQSYSMVGSRVVRVCTDKAKIKPIEAYVERHAAAEDAQLIGYHAAESHRARQHPLDKRPKLFPLVDLGIDNDGCKDIITAAGLPIPPKSGCWHCPFMRVGEIRDLFWKHPERFAAIARLEAISLERHPLPPPTVEEVLEECSQCNGGGVLADGLYPGACQFCGGGGRVKSGERIKPSPKRAQWGDTPVAEWVERFKREAAQGTLLDLPQDRQYDEIPCGCFDGDDDEPRPASMADAPKEAKP